MKALSVFAAVAASALSALAVIEGNSGANANLTAVGRGAATGSESQNLVAVGYNAGANALSTDSSIFLGKNAGSGVTTNVKCVAIGNGSLSESSTMCRVVAIGENEFAAMDSVTNTTSINGGQILVSETFDIAMLRPNSTHHPTNSPFYYGFGDTYIGGTGVTRIVGSQILVNGAKSLAKNLPEESLYFTIPAYDSQSNLLAEVSPDYDYVSRTLTGGTVSLKNKQKWIDGIGLEGTMNDIIVREQGVDSGGTRLTMGNIMDAIPNARQCIIDLLFSATLNMSVYKYNSWNAAIIKFTIPYDYECPFSFTWTGTTNGQSQVFSRTFTKIVFESQLSSLEFQAPLGESYIPSYSPTSRLYAKFHFEDSAGRKYYTHFTNEAILDGSYVYMRLGISVENSSRIRERVFGVRDYMDGQVDGIVDSMRLASTKYVNETCNARLRLNGAKTAFQVYDDKGVFLGTIPITTPSE